MGASGHGEPDGWCVGALVLRSSAGRPVQDSGDERGQRLFYEGRGGDHANGTSGRRADDQGGGPADAEHRLVGLGTRQGLTSNVRMEISG